MLDNNLIQSISKTFTSLLLLISIYFIFYYVLKIKKIRPNKKKIYTKRLFYILLFIFIFVFFKIWLHGFGQLFTILGLIGAALTITQKELLNNASGWFIISWRGLFCEGDYIKIQNFTGTVNSIGLFYFTLLDKIDTTKSSNKMHNPSEVIKVPNSTIITNSVVNYTANCKLVNKSLTIYLPSKSDIDLTRSILTKITASILKQHYKDNNAYQKEINSFGTKEELAIHNSAISFAPHSEEPIGIKATIEFYCYPEDTIIIKDEINLKILEEHKKNSKFYLNI